MEDRHLYFSFLLRVWLVGSQDPPTWRASLEDTHTGERVGFASLQAMYQYLIQQTDPEGKHRDDAIERG